MAVTIPIKRDKYQTALSHLVYRECMIDHFFDRPDAKFDNFLTAWVWFYTFGLQREYNFEQLKKDNNVWLPWMLKREDYPEWFPKHRFCDTEEGTRKWRDCISYFYEITLKNTLVEVKRTLQQGFGLFAKQRLDYSVLADQIWGFLDYSHYSIIERFWLESYGVDSIYEHEGDIAILYGPWSLANNHDHSKISWKNIHEIAGIMSGRSIRFMVGWNKYSFANTQLNSETISWLTVDNCFEDDHGQTIEPPFSQPTQLSQVGSQLSPRARRLMRRAIAAANVLSSSRLVGYAINTEGENEESEEEEEEQKGLTQDIHVHEILEPNSGSGWERDSSAYYGVKVALNSNKRKLSEDSFVAKGKQVYVRYQDKNSMNFFY